MIERLVITILGRDRPGLVEAVSRIVRAREANWEASRMARLAGRFAGVLLVSASTDHVDALVEELRELAREGLQVVVERGDGESETTRRSAQLEVVGNDRPGIIREVSAVLAQRGVNIDELESCCESAPMAGHNLFRMRARVALPEGLAPIELRQALEGLAGDLMVDIASADPDAG